VRAESAIARRTSNRRRALGPESTLVEMYSRPWNPSRVGRTISDCPSDGVKARPVKSPAVAGARTGILPVSTVPGG